MKTVPITINVPESVLREAAKYGMTKTEIKKTMETFALFQMISVMSKLKKREAMKLSKKIKGVAWKKLKTKLE